MPTIQVDNHNLHYITAGNPRIFWLMRYNQMCLILV